MFDQQPTRKRRFKPAWTDQDRDGAARVIQKSYLGAVHRRHVQRHLRMQERLRGGPDQYYNFEIDGKRYRFADVSTCWLRPENQYRKFVVMIAVNPVFDQFILVRGSLRPTAPSRACDGRRARSRCAANPFRCAFCSTPR